MYPLAVPAQSGHTSTRDHKSLALGCLIWLYNLQNPVGVGRDPAPTLRKGSDALFDSVGDDHVSDFDRLQQWAKRASVWRRGNSTTRAARVSWRLGGQRRQHRLAEQTRAIH